jgi:hypothetical protein
VQVELAGTTLFGTASVFDDHRQLGWLCEAFDGFPRVRGEHSKFEIGIFSKLILSMGADLNGRLEVRAELVVSTGTAKSALEGLTVYFLCDPAALDSFCQSIRSFSPDLKCEATLQGRWWE